MSKENVTPTTYAPKLLGEIQFHLWGKDLRNVSMKFIEKELFFPQVCEPRLEDILLYFGSGEETISLFDYLLAPNNPEKFWQMEIPVWADDEAGENLAFDLLTEQSLENLISTNGEKFFIEFWRTEKI